MHTWKVLKQKELCEYFSFFFQHYLSLLHYSIELLPFYAAINVKKEKEKKTTFPVQSLNTFIRQPLDIFKKGQKAKILYKKCFEIF